jgi:hypothetical protein
LSFIGFVKSESKKIDTIAGGRKSEGTQKAKYAWEVTRSGNFSLGLIVPFQFAQHYDFFCKEDYF